MLWSRRLCFDCENDTGFHMTLYYLRHTVVWPLKIDGKVSLNVPRDVETADLELRRFSFIQASDCPSQGRLLSLQNSWTLAPPSSKSVYSLAFFAGRPSLVVLWFFRRLIVNVMCASHPSTWELFAWTRTYQSKFSRLLIHVVQGLWRYKNCYGLPIFNQSNRTPPVFSTPKTNMQLKILIAAFVFATVAAAAPAEIIARSDVVDSYQSSYYSPSFTSLPWSWHRRPIPMIPSPSSCPLTIISMINHHHLHHQFITIIITPATIVCHVIPEWRKKH